MIKFLKRSLFWIFILIVLLTIIAEFSLFSLRTSNFYKPSFVANVEPQNFDYVVLGSSTGLTTLNTKLIDSLSDLNGINLSMDDTALPSHYLMLQHFLNSGHETKKAILCITPWDVAQDSPKIGNNDYRFLPFIHKKYIAQHFDMLSDNPLDPIRASSYMSFVGLSYYNTELLAPSLMSVINSEKRNRFDDRGNYGYPNSNYTPKQAIEEVFSLEFKNPYLSKLQNLCDANKIDLILYQSPIFNAKYDKQSTNYMLINHIDLLDSSTYFYDNIHVNAEGRLKATIAVTKELN